LKLEFLYTRKNMSQEISPYRGRPAEEGGHERVNLSLNRWIRDSLKKLGKGNISKFVEEKLKPHLKKLDPGEGCIYVKRIFDELEDGIRQALNRADRELAETLIALERKFEEEIKLCGIEEQGRYRRILRKI